MKRLIFFLCLFVVSCGGSVNKKHRGDENKNIIEKAQFFTVTEHEGYRLLEVINPWDTLKLLHRYILVNREDALPDSLPEGDIIRTPVQRIVAYTAVDIGSLAAIGEVDKVVGVCESKYILSSYIQDRLKSGDIKDLGTYTKPNIEQLLSSNPDLIISSPYSGQDYGLVEKLNIPIAECASYMEQTPLGRCEWIKFYAQFLNKQSVADSIFEDISMRYNKTIDLIGERAVSRPTIFADKRYGQVWYASPGNSYAARLYSDAGGDYLWKDNLSGNAIPLSFESVFKQAHNADVWLFTYFKPDGFMTLNELKEEYASYAEFAAFKRGSVYGCNSEKMPIYEESPLRPDLLLLDIAKILHPELFNDHEFVYYKKLE